MGCFMDDNFEEVRFRIPLHRRIIDWTTLGLFVLLALAMTWIVSSNLGNLNVRGLIALPFAYVFPVLYAKLIRSHHRAARMALRPMGLIIPGRDGSKLVVWRDIVKFKEARSYEGGLILDLSDTSRVIIPFVIEGYAEIRNYVLEKINARGVGVTM